MYFSHVCHEGHPSALNGLDAWEHLAFQNLQHGAAAGADVADLVSEPGLVDGRHRVAAANQSEGAMIGRDFGQCRGDGRVDDFGVGIARDEPLVLASAPALRAGPSQSMS